jgi:dipeptide/tripeptide permease
MMLESVIPVETFSVINPILVVVLVSGLAPVYVMLARKGIHISITTRMSLGFTLMTIAYAISGVLQHFVIESFQPGVNVKNGVCVDPSSCVSTFWQLPQWFLLSLGEALISPEGLKLTYMNVGPMMKSQSLAIFLLMSGLGSYFTLFLGLATQNISSLSDLTSPKALATMDQGISTPLRYVVFGAIGVVANIWFVLWCKYVFIYKEDEENEKLVESSTDEKQNPLAKYQESTEQVSKE